MLRQFIQSDLDQLIAIEASVQVDPWSRIIFQTCLKSGCLVWVIEENTQLIGFIFISVNQEECHIYNLAVDKRHQHRGWGRKLMEQALDYAKNHGVHLVYLEVRETNARAMALYKTLGFEVIGIRKDYYENPIGYEDAMVLAKQV